VTEARVSVAIALHNEEEVFPELFRRLVAVLDRMPGGPHEMVFVDDGSTDRSFDLILEAAATDNRVVGVRLSRNFGHQAALTAALETVTGDVVIAMDGDLQDRPEEIPRFVAEYEKGFDVVYARRVRRKESVPLRVSYFLFYRLLNRLAEVEIPVDSGDFALLSRRIVDQINLLPERNRYIRGLRTWVGYPQVGVQVERDARVALLASVFFDRRLGHRLGEGRRAQDELEGIVVPVQRLLLIFVERRNVVGFGIHGADDQ